MAYRKKTFPLLIAAAALGTVLGAAPAQAAPPRGDVAGGTYHGGTHSGEKDRGGGDHGRRHCYWRHVNGHWVWAHGHRRWVPPRTVWVCSR